MRDITILRFPRIPHDMRGAELSSIGDIAVQAGLERIDAVRHDLIGGLYAGLAVISTNARGQIAYIGVHPFGNYVLDLYTPNTPLRAALGRPYVRDTATFARDHEMVGLQRSGNPHGSDLRYRERLADAVQHNAVRAQRAFGLEPGAVLHTLHEEPLADMLERIRFREQPRRPA